LDRKTFSHPEVREALRSHVRLKVDLTSADSPLTKAVAERFGVQAVPTVILLGGDGLEVAGTRVIGFLPAPEFLRQAKLSASGS
jgi:thiol:disulfide interchange protein DsbD